MFREVDSLMTLITIIWMKCFQCVPTGRGYATFVDLAVYSLTRPPSPKSLSVLRREPDCSMSIIFINEMVWCGRVEALNDMMEWYNMLM